LERINLYTATLYNRADRNSVTIHRKRRWDFGEESTGYQPRDAALKCASKGKTKIVLRESGTKKLHLFNGTREQVNKPEGAPDWLPDKVWKPNVEKVGTRQLKWNVLARNPNDLFEF